MCGPLNVSKQLALPTHHSPRPSTLTRETELKDMALRRLRRLPHPPILLPSPFSLCLVPKRGVGGEGERMGTGVTSGGREQ